MSLKPAEGEVETVWRSEVLTTLPTSTGFRVAAPVRAGEATRWVAGHTPPDDAYRPTVSLVLGLT